eukprot:snap_masked-scaffold_19-processed-gene-3.34-mRNA-1 protein AED:1.00 eAED:1.00 QI:0/0/0/0/1/1/2/0/241
MFYFEKIGEGNLDQKLEGKKGFKLKEKLQQYGLLNFLVWEEFSYSGGLVEGREEEFMLDFLNSGKITGAKGKASSIGFEELKCTILNTSFFNPLKDLSLQLVEKSGMLKQCMKFHESSIQINNRLTEFFLDEKENSSSNSATEDVKINKNEFIYRLLTLLVIGGEINQPELTFGEYLDTTKSLYKELVHVYKREKTSNEVFVGSRVFKMKSVNDNENFLFCRENTEIQSLIIFATTFHGGW